jgi:hypothetical protein
VIAKWGFIRRAALVLGAGIGAILVSPSLALADDAAVVSDAGSGGDGEDLSNWGLQPSTTPDRFACSAGGSGHRPRGTEAVTVLSLGAVGLALASRTRQSKAAR